MVKPSARRLQGRVRIIAGEWRGRRIEIPEGTAVRPTPDRVRETVFNWLRGSLVGVRAVRKDWEVFVISSSGVGIRTPVSKISKQQRSATGVKLMDVGDGSLAAFTIVQGEDV